MWWKDKKKRQIESGRERGKKTLLRMRSSDMPDVFGADIAVMSLADVSCLIPCFLCTWH